MIKIYYRITYDNIGIYEALKTKLWNSSKKSKEEWEKFKYSSSVNWLKTPPTYGSNNYSFFTKLGFSLFMKYTYPLIIKYLDEDKINIEKYSLDIKQINLIYSDEHQIVIEKEIDTE